MVADPSGLRLPGQEIALKKKWRVDALCGYAAGEHIEVAGLCAVEVIGICGQGETLVGDLVDTGGVQVGFEESP